MAWSCTCGWALEDIRDSPSGSLRIIFSSLWCCSLLKFFLFWSFSFLVFPSTLRKSEVIGTVVGHHRLTLNLINIIVIRLRSQCLMSNLIYLSIREIVPRFRCNIDSYGTLGQTIYLISHPILILMQGVYTILLPILIFVHICKYVHEYFLCKDTCIKLFQVDSQSF